MKNGDLVFVYGSLRQSQGANYKLQGRSEFVGTDRINGLLYSVSWFPGVKLLPDKASNDYDPALPTVVGEVYEVTDKGLPASLDAYEGYPNLYDRVQVETEHSRLVWVYVYNHDVGENQLVTSGDWLENEEQAA